MLTLLNGCCICTVPIYAPRQKFMFLLWIYWIYVFIFSLCTALFFLLRISASGFTAEVLMRPSGHYVFIFIFILSCISFCRSVFFACLLPPTTATGEVLQYLTRSALLHVELRHIPVFRLFTFPAFLSKTRQYTQDFIVPSNFYHNLDTLLSKKFK